MRVHKVPVIVAERMYRWDAKGCRPAIQHIFHKVVVFLSEEESILPVKMVFRRDTCQEWVRALL